MERGLVDRFDWFASRELLEERLRTEPDEMTSMADEELVAWIRALRFYIPFLEVAPSLTTPEMECLEVMQERLQAIGREALQRPRIRNLSLVRKRRSLEEMTRPRKEDGHWRPRHGRRPELDEIEEKAVLDGVARGLSIRSLARTLASGTRPLSSNRSDLEAWFREVELRRRSAGRPRADSTTAEPGEPDVEETTRIKRLIERTLQASRLMASVGQTGPNTSPRWPVRNE